MSKARTMTAGARLTSKVNTADDNYGDKKNGGASTTGRTVFTNSVLAARGVKHPYKIYNRGGLIMGGVGMIHVDASKHADGFKIKF